jgi:hypothetical protein
MQILDCDNQGARVTPFEAHLLEGVKGPSPDRFGGQRRNACCPLLHAQQLQEIGGSVFSVHIDFL